MHKCSLSFSLFCVTFLRISSYSKAFIWRHKKKNTALFILKWYLFMWVCCNHTRCKICLCFWFFLFVFASDGYYTRESTIGVARFYWNLARFPTGGSSAPGRKLDLFALFYRFAPPCVIPTAVQSLYLISTSKDCVHTYVPDTSVPGIHFIWRFTREIGITKLQIGRSDTENLFFFCKRIKAKGSWDFCFINTLTSSMYFERLLV